MRLLTTTMVLGALAVATPATATTTVYNSAPTGQFAFGSGNNYSPANAAVLSSNADELALRFHQTFFRAPASDANGVYSFALGTDPVSFDWSILGDTSGSLITITNILSGSSFSYNPFFAGNDNEINDSGAVQNSFRLNWAGLGFDPNVNNTFSVNLTAGGNSLTTFAKIGAGAVPEPATWALMLLGFMAIGATMRNKKTTQRRSVTYA